MESQCRRPGHLRLAAGCPTGETQGIFGTAREQSYEGKVARKLAAAQGQRQAWIFPLIIGAITMRPLARVASHVDPSSDPYLDPDLVVAGLNLTFGFAGEFILGQVALFAASAYVAGILAVHGWDATLTIPAAGIVAALLGLVTALAGLRLGGWGLAMSSFFSSSSYQTWCSCSKARRVAWSAFSASRSQAVGPAPNQSRLLPASHRCPSRGHRHFSQLRTVAPWKRPAGSSGKPCPGCIGGPGRLPGEGSRFVLGAIPAGLAGGLYAYLDQYITPSYFDLTLAITFIAASVLGGTESIYRAIAGSAILQLRTYAVTAFQSYALIAYGALLVVGGVAFRVG